MTLQNQQIFKQFDVSQDPGKPTSESLEVLNQMANLSRNRRSSTQNVSLYNLYKNRSYRCSIDMMGNALIQPTMYFNIRNIPMFSGPYMITSVRHRVTENGFDTSFEGIRQPFYSLPKIDNFIQSLNQNILTSIQETIQQNESKKLTDPNTIIQEKNNVLSNIIAEETLSSNQDCASEINNRYLGFVQIESPKQTYQTLQGMKNLIGSKFANKGYKETLQYYTQLMFCFIYVDTGNSTGFKSYENNFSTIDLKTYYANYSDFFNKKYFCVNRGTDVNYPVVSFIDIDTFLNFAINKVTGLIQTTLITSLDLAEYLSELYVTKYPVPKSEKVWTEMTITDKQKIIDRFTESIEKYNSLI